MKASELRIGNWVKSPHTSNEVQVTLAMFSDAYVHEEADDYTYFDHIQPIPLTEEWLLRFGINTWFLDGRFSIVLNEDGSFSVYAHANGRSVFITHISFVHTLQNFYHVLKGQELTINERE